MLYNVYVLFSYLEKKNSILLSIIWFKNLFRLLTNAQYHEEELARRKEKQADDNNTIKGQKLITLSSRIADNDVMIGVKKMGKLLEKQYEVKVVISGDESEQSKMVFYI